MFPIRPALYAGRFWFGWFRMGRLKKAAGRLDSGTSRISIPAGVSGSARRAKGSSSTARGYGYRWQQARLHYLAEHPLCAMCAADGKVVPATVVDHIKPHGGNDALFWDSANWQPLCKHCHDSRKQKQERQGSRFVGGGV